MVNEQYEPDATEDAVISVCRREHRVNAPRVVAETDLDRAAVNHALRDLATAGWIRKVARGLYEYVEDPRVGDGEATAERADSARESGAVSRARDALAEWDPDNANRAKATPAVLTVVAWLAAQDEPQQKADVLGWAQGERIEGYAASTLWEKVAQPGLAELERAGVVERTANVGYEIVEEEE